MGAVTVEGILSETLVSLSDVRTMFPGGQRSAGCIENWVRDGVGGVKLEICRVGYTRFTSLEAVRRFLAATNQTTGGKFRQNPLAKKRGRPRGSRKGGA